MPARPERQLQSTKRLVRWAIALVLFAAATVVWSALAFMDSKAAAKAAAQTAQPAANPTLQSQKNPPTTAPNAGSTSRPAIDLPPIVFRPDSLDLGAVRPGEHASGSVEIFNTSDRTVVIEKSWPSCTCTSVNLKNTVIKPGQSVPLPVEYKGSYNLGPRKLSVRVRVAGFHDFAEVPMKVTIAMPVFADPPHITSLVDPATGQIELNGVVTISSEDHKPFRITAVQGEPPNFVDFDPAKDQPRDQYKLKWDLSGYNQQTCMDSKGVRLPSWICVETDHPACAVVDIEVRHQCNHRSYLKPGDTWMLEDRRMNIGEVKPGTPVDVAFTGKWLKATHDDIQLVSSESPQFKALLKEIKQIQDGFELHITVTPTSDAHGLIYGDLRIHSKTEDWPITIIGSVRN